jgi:hypothetical protein
VQRNSLEKISSTQVRCNLVVEWPRVVRSASARNAKSNHETARVSIPHLSGARAPPGRGERELAGGSEILHNSLVWLVLEDPRGSCNVQWHGVSRAGGRRSVSLFTFQYLRCLAVRPLTPRQPADAVGDGARAISFRGIHPGIRDGGL